MMQDIVYEFKGGKTNEEAKCILCSKTFGLLTMGSSALDRYAKGRKHDDMLKSWTSAVDSCFYNKQKDKSQSTNLFQSKLTSGTMRYRMCYVPHSAHVITLIDFLV